MSHGKEPKKICSRCERELCIRHFYWMRVRYPRPYKGRKRYGETHYMYTKKIRRPECKECFKAIVKDYQKKQVKLPNDYYQKSLADLVKEMEKFNA